MRLVFIIGMLLAVSPAHSQDPTSSEIRINEFISGTLLQPVKQTDTLAIIIAGSGPTDRNGNQQMMQNNSLKQLAQQLTKNGFATFRYDKRLFALMRQNALIEEQLSFDDFVSDAASTVNYFEQDFKTIVLIGHSQGALIAKLAAQQTKVSKLVSIAGAGQAIDLVILDQITKQAPGLAENAQQALTDLKETGTSKNYNPALASIFRPSVQPFMKSWIKYDPAEEISALDIPILIVTGTKDLQVPLKEGELLKEAQPKSEYAIIESMNHVLKTIEGDDIENSKSYNEASRPINTELIKEITRFIRE
ncbi:alpha/beta hydrolase [Leeuwenhoekiella palythoae]|uniref:alpha/beta hydrolase n=1 Tax=Leeuwenhoekiella palythoae TaxID=573501 RepID=UPI001CE0E0A9|nr:alpha/beta hydrolase [Leeuwenhoekiella palythoae]UBZ11111.1 alpha/beta hydrolase [Leeuwenhoekiella palythoae]